MHPIYLEKYLQHTPSVFNIWQFCIDILQQNVWLYMGDIGCSPVCMAGM